MVAHEAAAEAGRDVGGCVGGALTRLAEGLETAEAEGMSDEAKVFLGSGLAIVGVIIGWCLYEFREWLRRPR